MVINVVLVVHALSMFFRLTLGLLTVEPVLALCFSKTVNLRPVSMTLTLSHK
jgi:hypothetical protein